MVDNFVVWGSSGHAMVLADVIYSLKGRIIALFDNNPEATSCLDGVPLFAGQHRFAEWGAQSRPPGPLYGAVAIGGHRGDDRRTIGRFLESHKIFLPRLIHKSAVVSPSAEIGTGTQVLAGAVVSARVQIAPYCIINNRANIDHECILAEGVHVAPGAVLCGCISVGQSSMIGAGAVVLPRLIVGANAIVGAGAVVTKNVPDGAVVVGNPAKIFNPIS